MDNEKDCMLKEITGFLIRVGNHCIECKGEPFTPSKLFEETTVIKLKPKPKIKVDTTNIVPTVVTPKKPVAIKTDNSVEFKKQQKNYRHGIKLSYLEKWVQNNNFEVFTLEQFFKAYPKQKKNNLLNRNISRLIADKKIIQLGKNKFKVV